MSNTIIIIESPNKKGKIEKITGCKTYATVGHFKDLPNKNYLNYETYEPTFDFINDEVKKKMNFIFAECKDKEVIIATDPDREGYAIGFMFYQVIKNVAKSIKRAEFHEITEQGIKKGLNSAVEFTKSNFNEFEAFKARAVGDKLVGFVLSPKYISLLNDKNVSIGRVQTPALNLIVQREKEINEFNKLPESEKIDYKIKAKISKDDCEFFIKNDTIHKTKQEADEFINFIKDTPNAILQSIKTKDSKKSPPAPFRTSQLQEKANQAFGFESKETMLLAQNLFEQGLITYTRTDSNSVSDEFLNEVESFFGKEEWYQRREYKAGKQSQAEAHEAIRITHLHTFEDIDKIIDKTNQEVSSDKLKLSDNHKKLYTMIYLNSVLSQAKDCITQITQYEFLIKSVIFTASTSQIKYKGFKDIFVKEESDENENSNKDEDLKIDLSKFKENDSFAIKGYESIEVRKQAPSRYKESNFISLLEKEGIGRPSTYASFLPTLLKRQYIEIQNKGKKQEIVPTPKGLHIIEILLQQDEWITTPEYTRIMENILEEISNNKCKYIDFVKPLHAKMGYQKSEFENKAPSEKQIAFAEKLCKEQNKEIPKEIYTSISECQKLIETLKKTAPKKPPSEKQIALAEDRAKKLNVELPKGYKDDYKICSDFIEKSFKK